MSQTDIYLSAGTSGRELIQLACRICEKVFSSGQSAIIVCTNALQAKEMDDQLWAFKDSAFIPHRTGMSPTREYPIVISHKEVDSLDTQINGIETDAVIYLYPELLSIEPLHTRRFIIVANETETLDKARQLFKSLKQTEQNINSHDLR